MTLPNVKELYMQIIREVITEIKKKEKEHHSLAIISTPILHKTVRLKPDLLDYIYAQRTQTYT